MLTRVLGIGISNLYTVNSFESSTGLQVARDRIRNQDSGALFLSDSRLLFNHLFDSEILRIFHCPASPPNQTLPHSRSSSDGRMGCGHFCQSYTNKPGFKRTRRERPNLSKIVRSCLMVRSRTENELGGVTLDE